MNITVQQHSLSRELGLLAKAADRKSTMPVLGCVLIRPNGTSATLTATDLQMAIHTRIDCVVDQPGDAAIPIARLRPFVSGLSGGDVSIKVSANGHATIKQGRTTARIPSEASGAYPELPATQAEPIARLPISVLAKLARSTAYAIAETESRFTLSGARIEINGDALRMISTDGHRLAFIEIPSDGGNVPNTLLIPRRLLAEIVRLNDASPVGESALIFADQSNIWIRSGSRTIWTRKLDGNFPDYERILPRDMAGTCEVSRESLQSTLNRMFSFADERSKSVKFTVADGSLTVQAAAHGECEDAIDATTEGNVTIGLSAQYLKDFLGSVNVERVRIRFKDSNSAVRLEPIGGAEGETYFCVVMPMRLN